MVASVNYDCLQGSFSFWTNLFLAAPKGRRACGSAVTKGSFIPPFVAPLPAGAVAKHNKT
jgi:hypothetical protein